MKFSWQAALVAALAFFAILAATNAHANGGAIDMESAHRSSGDVFIPTKRFALNKEELNIKLNPEDYEVHVTYQVNNVDTSAEGVQTRMYFPVMCIMQDELTYAKTCVKKFTARIDNNQEVVGKIVFPTEISSNPLLDDLSKRLIERGAKDWSEDAEDGPPVPFFYVFDLPSTPIREIHVFYQADYDQVVANGTTSEESNTYSNARFFYDFFPAAAWAGGNIAQLQINLDTSNMHSEPAFNKENWPFLFKGNRASLTIVKPDFHSLSPLEIDTNNANYREFSGHMRAIRQGKARYKISVVHAERSKTGHADVKALYDGNPKTFWCWRGNSATLLLQADRQIVNSHKSQYEGKNREDWFKLPFWSIGVMNGATQSKTTFERYGLIKEIVLDGPVTKNKQEIKVPYMMLTEHGLVARRLGYPIKYTANGEIKEAEDPPELPLPLMTGTKDLYDSRLAFDRIDEPVDHDANINSAAQARAERKKITQLKYLIKIKNVHRRKGQQESCISEIYPIYYSGS